MPPFSKCLHLTLGGFYFAACVTHKMQNTEEIISKYVVDANLFQLGSTNPEKKSSSLLFIFSIFNWKQFLHFFQIVMEGICPGVLFIGRLIVIVERLLFGWLLFEGFLTGGFWPRFNK